jgi:enoyl-CoA hydratase/carnithine racemase
LTHGVVSRLVADGAELDEVTMEMAGKIAAAAFTVKMARRTLFSLGAPEVQRSINEEAVPSPWSSCRATTPR